MNHMVKIIGGGLAGSEAAYQLACSGVPVTLYEMRPTVKTCAHKTGHLAELVCSNSFKSDSLENASGVLKAEMRKLGSLIMTAADLSKLPAGKALAVDRELFSKIVHEKLTALPEVTLVNEEIAEVPEGPCIVATGPLTSPALAENLRQCLGADHLYFFDAISPLIERDSIDIEKVFMASRYEHGDDYINCPMNEEEYSRFVAELANAERAELHDFEESMMFEGCLPVEEIARRGADTLRFGPMKPVGLPDPRPGRGREPFAAVQLRQENLANTEVGLVGFQTRLKWGEQKRVFSLIPGLEHAEFCRFGQMHKNLFVNAPILLDKTLRLRRNPDVMLAGQITGVEGYLESAATGLVAGLNLARILRGEDPADFPATTAFGALLNYITTAVANYQPTNITFGLFAPLEQEIRKKQVRNQALAGRALAEMDALIERLRRAPSGVAG